MPFKRTIGVWGLLLTSINCMIGGGWLLSTYYISTFTGPAAIISWVISAFMVIIIAFCFSELSTTFPIAGGIARYSHFSHGTSISFGMSLLAWLSCVACAPTEVQTIMQYLNPYYPWMMYQIDNVSHFTKEGFSIAIVLLAVMSYLNIKGIEIIIKINSTFAVWKIIFPLITIVCIFYARFEPSNFTSQGFMPYGWTGVLEATTFCVFSFLGFREATSLASEVKRPHIAIPIAVIGSVVCCFLLYVGLQVALIGAVSPEMIASGWRNLSYTADSAPIFGLAKSLGLFWLSSTISADAVVSPFGTGTSYTATSARLVYAISKNGFLPKSLSNLNINGVPTHALLLNFFVGVIMFMTMTKWMTLVNFQTLAMFIAYAVGPIALYSLRAQLPELHRPFKIPFGFFGAVIVFYCCNLLSLWMGWETFRLILVALICGYTVMIGYSCYNKINLNQWKFKHSAWIVPYFSGLAAISYLCSYRGGIAVIPVGWDFLVIFIFSVIILYLAHQSRLSREDCMLMIERKEEFDFDESI